MSKYGKFHDFCRDSGDAHSTIPVCNLFEQSATKSGSGFGGCDLRGIELGDGKVLANLGSILACALALLVTLALLWRSERKKAAVGRREMQLFLFGYAAVSICEIFSVGHFPIGSNIRIGFSAAHMAAVVATVWILMLNGIVGYQLLDDGTPVSIGLILLSALALFVGTGYIALDTGFGWTDYWNSSLSGENQSYSLFTLYQLAPLVFLAVFFLLEAYLVLRILGERKPMIYLTGAAILFAVGQVFQYVVSVHLCSATGGKINGGFFETLFTLFSVILIWVFWSSITEDDWPMQAATGGGTYT